MKRLLLLTVLMSFPIIAEVNSWECGKFEGATIVAHDGTFLGELGPKWESDSIFNDSSEHSTNNTNKNGTAPYSVIFLRRVYRY